MHMADALLTPAVGGAFWAASGALVAHSARKVSREQEHAKTPLMGVLGAFVFAAQMINFTIPGTGSSGHLGGGLLLTVILGPYRAFITLASVLTVQCLFFADGGLLALGCNIFNLAFFPAFIAFPFIFKPIAGSLEKTGRLALAAFSAAAAGLLMGALAVVIETVASGVTELTFSTFALFMLPVHLAIGIVEGAVTLGVVAFVRRAEPSALAQEPASANGARTVALVFIVAALLIGGAVSWFASEYPDGLEWSIGKVTGSEEVEGTLSGIAQAANAVQEKLAFLPDYSFKGTGEGGGSATGTSVSGILGSLIVLALAGLLGFVLRARTKTHGHA
jgi:cobalt/nickel transport system permease protein